MRVLLSTIGSRGDVQPLVALALALREVGQGVRFCAPPDFRELVEGFGFEFVALGPELRGTASAGAVRPTVEQLRMLAKMSVDTQFATVPRAAEGCDVIVAGGYLQIAAPTVAELMGIAVVQATYCPIVLPSRHHAPPPLSVGGDAPSEEDDIADLWARDARRWNDTWAEALNAHRVSAGLAPVDDVRGHILTERPWLAADPTLGPWPVPGDSRVVRTGAWVVPDTRALPDEVVAFLEAGEPPVYFGFGSMPAAWDLAQEVVKSARAVGRRVIISRGWAGLTPVEDEPDCLFVGEVNHGALFPQVAAVVHHGGAGTTTVAAAAGVPQVVVPQMFDQHYWARRVQRLGAGVAHPPGVPDAGSLGVALDQVLRPEVAERARTVAGAVRTDGAVVAAGRLVAREL